MLVRKMFASFAAVAVAVVASLTIAAPASAAHAFEADKAVATSAIPPVCIGLGSPGGCGFFVSDGDHFFVKDSLSDGHSAAIYWHKYLASSPNTLYRWGSCVNSLGSGKMGQCNKNFTEGSKVEYKICTFEVGSVVSDVNSYFECGDVWRSVA
ncbi:hypothetical protein [Actinoplanes sp. NPDC051494]|uniref:hypothetical protein n=1 Tax=Actinoplanes sp. NPDC051494 TaxID=3363907 RepID=UPI0037A80A1E